MKKLPWSTILLLSADSFLVEAIDVLQFKGRDALTTLVISDYVHYEIRQRSTSYVQGGRHEVFLPRLVTSKTDPSLPLASTMNGYQKPSLAVGLSRFCSATF